MLKSGRFAPANEIVTLANLAARVLGSSAIQICL
jgi:hypothetical protein